MSSIIIVLIFIILFMPFVIKKEYTEILITLIIGLIIDFAIVKILSTAPILGTIAVSVGKPFIQIFVYVIIKMIIMGAYYTLLQKNGVIAIVGYLIINVLLNIFYITISGNVFIDIIFNTIIAGIILLAYKKSNYLEDLKWFTVASMIIDFILENLIISMFFK